MELLIASGIDYLIFDTSNGLCYNDIAVQLYDVLLDLQGQGFKVPKIVYFFVGTSMTEGSDTSGVIGQVRSVYDEFYSNPKYESLWFKPNGKPIMIISKNGYNDLAEPTHKDHELCEYYDWRFATDVFKPGTDPVNEGVWPWMDWKYPQDVFYYDQQEKTEGIMCVSVGQHPTVRFSDTQGTRGRGWTKDGGNDHENWVKNLNLEQQWDNAIANDSELKYIFLQGWNEWTATKFEMDGTYFTVDTYNNEYSRDIEPSNDPMLKDNAFLLNMRKIREYKMTEAKHYKYDKVTIDYKQVNDPQWDNIRAYQDVVGEATERNAPRFDSAQGFDFVDTTNRNDIKSVKVARDDEYFYFKVECLNDMTKKEDKDKSWMNIHINTQNVGVKTDSRGYSYVINRDINTEKGLTTISRAKGGNEYEIVGYGNIVVEGKTMVLRIPLAALSLNDRNYDISFKVSDNIQDSISEGFLSFYNTGDCAPAGKLNYRFGY